MITTKTIRKMIAEAGLEAKDWNASQVAARVNAYIADATHEESFRDVTELDAETVFEWISESNTHEHAPDLYELGLGAGWPAVWAA